MRACSEIQTQIYLKKTKGIEYLKANGHISEKNHK